ncbi:MAG: dienelactone hydrolase family protein [Acidimicrobiales bacterium]
MSDALTSAAADLDAAVVEPLRIPTANPRNVFEAMSANGPGERLEIDAVFAAPIGRGPSPTVVIVPGSAGVSPNHVSHAHTLLAAGFAVCLLDPFAARSVVSTVANQAQYSFAASAYDVLATLAVLGAHPLVDRTRIAAQGHSRGGSAVLMAAMRPFAAAVPAAPQLAGAYAAYPWCGQQFLRPDTGTTVIRAVIGDQDEWCSVLAVQAQVQAIALRGGDVSLRIVPGAHHSFDRLEPVHDVPEARVSPNAPVEYLADDGSMIDPHTGIADPARGDIDQFRAAIAAGFGQRGARLGGSGDQPTVFRNDMLDFHQRVLASPRGSAAAPAI